MSNKFDGYTVKIDRKGNAVDVIVALSVRVDDFFTRQHEIIKAWYFVRKDGSLEILNDSACELLGDYENKIHDVIEKEFRTYDETGFDTETIQEEDHYVCEYVTERYSRSPKLRQKVVDAIAEQEWEMKDWNYF